MEKLNRGDKIYLDEEQKEESCVNSYLSCRDGVVEVYEYTDCSGYGAKTRLFYCQNTKHESISIIRQTYSNINKKWMEEEMTFDSDSFVFLEALLKTKTNELGGKYTMVRDYSQKNTFLSKEKTTLFIPCEIGKNKMCLCKNKNDCEYPKCENCGCDVAEEPWDICKGCEETLP